MSTTVLGANKLSAISDLIRLTRQYGTLLVLWPTLWSLVVASGGAPAVKHLVIFTLGAFLMRSAGCAINDIADRKIDPLVERTRARPLASGSLNVREALGVFFALSLLAFALVLFLNTFTILLSLVAFSLAGIYPFVKRFSHLPQAFLGAAFGWGALMAWAAVENSLGLVPLLIFTANIFWSMAYDTIYALMDIEDDRRIGVKSAAILFGGGVYTALNLLYAAFSATLAAAGWFSGLGVIFYGGLFLAFVSFLWVVRSVKINPARESAFNGFLANAAAGGMILLFMVLDMNL